MKIIRPLLIFLLTLSIVIPTTQVDAAHPVLERFSKRYLKKNKLKKLGKRADRQSVLDIDLESYSISFDHDIIGMEPSWMIKEKHYDNHYFNLLSTLVLGEYDINPDTGLPRDIKAFEAHYKVKDDGGRSKVQDNIIQEADFANPQLTFLIQLTYSEDYGGNKDLNRYNLLTNEEVFSNLSKKLNTHLDTLSLAYKIKPERLGIFLDFNLDDNKNFLEYLDFVKRLRANLGEERKLYIVVPASIKARHAYNYNQIQELLEIADKLVINATNFDEPRRSGKLTPPVNFEPNYRYSLKGTLKQYMIPPDFAGRNISKVADEYMLSPEMKEMRAKFSIMLPYFGVGYEIDQRTKAQKKIGRITFDNFREFILSKKNPQINYTTNIIGKNDSIYGVYEIKNPTTRKTQRYYIDDELSLENKYFYIKDSLGIDNVALNALSYYKNNDGKIKPMWAIIALTYGKKREKLGWIIASFLMGFIPIGFMFSIYKNWEVRNALAKYGNIFTRFNLFFILFIFLFLTAANVIPRGTVALIVAIVILGAFFLYIMFKKILMRSKKYVNIIK